MPRKVSENKIKEIDKKLDITIQNFSKAMKSVLKEASLDDLEIEPLYEEQAYVSTFVVKDKKKNISIPVALVYYQTKNAKTGKTFGELSIRTPTNPSMPLLMPALDPNNAPVLGMLQAVGSTNKNLIPEHIKKTVKEVLGDLKSGKKKISAKKIIEEVFNDMDIEDIRFLP